MTLGEKLVEYTAIHLPHLLRGEHLYDTISLLLHDRNPDIPSRTDGGRISDPTIRKTTGWGRSPIIPRQSSFPQSSPNPKS
jgi:hypothetical protein